MTDIGFTDFGSGLSDGTGPQGGGTDGGASSGTPSVSPPSPFGTFGSGLFNRGQMFANRPQMDSGNPVQDRINSLSAARTGLQRSLNNPLRAFLKPHEYMQDAQNAAQLSQQIFQTQQAVQDVQADRQAAYNGGLRPETLNALPVNATAKTIFNAWGKDYAGGSWAASKYLDTLGPAGEGLKNEQEGNFIPALDSNNQQAQGIVDKLTTAAKNGDPAYAAQLDALGGADKVGKLLSDYVPNFAVPQKADAWNVRGKGVAGQLAQAQNVVAKYNQAQAGLGQYQNIADDKVADSVQGSMFKGSRSVQKNGGIEGGSTVKFSNNEFGSILPSNSAGNINKDAYGAEWNNATSDNRKVYNDQLNEEQTKGAITQFKANKRFRDIANTPSMWTTAAGTTAIQDNFSATERAVKENSNASGNVGLAKLLHTNIGGLGEAINGLKGNFATISSWVSAHAKGATINDNGDVVDKNGQIVQGSPRLSNDTIKGLKAVANFGYDQALSEAKDRLGGPLFTAGRMGLPEDQTGIDKPLLDTVRGSYDAGKQSYIRDVQAHPYVTVGDQHVMLRQDSPNPLAKKFAPLKDANDLSPAPSPGYENPPANGAVILPQGDTASRSQMELHYAKAVNNGMATQAKPGEPGSPIQTQVTPNGAGLLRTIRGSESNGDNPNSYNLIVGGGRLKTYDDHPGNLDPSVGIDTKNGHSTASGAYQFTKTTWNEVAGKYGNLLDRDSKGNVSFTPQNQDKAAWLLAQERYNKATGSNLETDLSNPAKHDQVLKALSPTWTSLPGGSEPNNATASRKGILGRLTTRLGNMYTPPGMKPGSTEAAAAIYGPEFDPAVQKARLGSGELPATGSTAGATIGEGVAGLPGGMIGGAIGGAGGQMIQNRATGKPLMEGVGREAGLGVVQGIVPGSRQVLGAMARSVGAGGVAAANEAATNPDATAESIATEGAKGGAAALAGEGAFGVVGLALGRSGQLYNKFTDATKQQLNEAGAVIAKGKPESPKSAGGVPVSETAKTAHEADTKQYETAVQTAKDHGLDPEDLAHAVQQVPAGQVAVNKVVAQQKADLGARYQEIKQDVGATGVGAPKQQPLDNGPVSLVGKHADVPQEYMGRAVQAENNIIAPAKNWEEKYQQIFDERSKLLEEQREALPNGDTPDANKARALKAIADNVGDQQRAMLRYVYGPKGNVMANKLDQLQRDYAEFMGATKGGDIIENMASKNGVKAAASTAAFNKYAKDDKGAQQVATTLASAIRNPKSEGGRNVKFVASAIMGTLGLHAPAALILATEGPKMLSDWTLRRAAGSPITLKMMLVQKLRQQVGKDKGRASAAFGRGAAQAEMTQ